MKKLLRPTDFLLLVVSGMLDIFVEMKDPANLLTNYYENFHGFVPERWRKRNFNQIVKRSLRTEDIERGEKDGNVYLKLTGKGQTKIERRFPLLSLQNKRWDLKWRFVIFDIEEVERWRRTWLRKKLKMFGFGMVQKSVWLSPHDFLGDLREFFEAKGLASNIILVETENIFAGDVKEFADRVWKLNKLNNKYEEICQEGEKINQTIGEIEQSYSKKREVLKKSQSLHNRFFLTVMEDPFLPKELLPEDWRYEKARLSIVGLRKNIIQIKTQQIKSRYTL